MTVKTFAYQAQGKARLHLQLVMVLATIAVTGIVTALATAAVALPAAGLPAAVRVHPLGAGPRVASGRGQSAADSRADDLATRLRASVNRLRQNRASGGSAAGRVSARESLARLRESAGDRVVVRMRPRRGTPMQIRGAVLEPAVAGGATSADTDQATARTFLSKRRDLLRLDDPDSELVLKRRDVDHLNRRHLRFTQHYRGLAAWPAELVVHLDPAGNVDGLDGAYIPTPRGLRSTPAIDSVSAVTHARASFAGGPTARVLSGPELIVYAPGDRSPRLAWKVELAGNVAERWLVVVDAIRGAVLTAFNQIPNVAGSGADLFGTQRDLDVFRDNDGTFFMIDTSKESFDPTSQPPALETTRGAITVLDARNQPPSSQPEVIPDLFFVTSGNANAWSPADAVSAAFGLSETYDYFLERHDRKALDGQDGSMVAAVRLGQNFFNAFWNGSMMIFGDAEPFAGSLDVVAHELTHGVTDYSANLVYRDQSGAMNEAFSDIFGEMVEARTFGDNDWLLGTDLSEPIRDMANPGRFGDPATFSDFLVTDLDNGGVHSNSGIFNRAFYLVAEGLDDALGLSAAERIFYQALSTRLVANSQFVDGRLACIASAEELFGAGSRQARVVAEAFDEVEIVDGDTTPPPDPFPGSDGVDSTLALYFDEIEESYFLVRREDAQQDDPEGMRLIDVPVAAARPAVSGDGSFAVFVNAFSDVCLVQTDGTPIDPESGTVEECLGFEGFISSVGLAPDGDHFGFVLLDDEGNPDNVINVIDLSPGGETRTFELLAPSEDGPTINTVLYADTMDFTANNQFLLYDALNVIDLFDGSQIFAWSIYGLELDSGEIFSIVPPIPGLDIGYPALSQTSDNFLAFDAFDSESGRSTVMTTDLTTGVKVEIDVVDGFGVPSYNGDDSAIVYSQNDETPTGYSIRRQAVSNRLTPEGNPTLWLEDADFGVIYRRGDYDGPRQPPEPGACVSDCNENGAVTVDELLLGVSAALVGSNLNQCRDADFDGNGRVTVEELVTAVLAVIVGCAP